LLGSSYLTRMANPPITIPASGGYVPSVDGFTPPYSGKQRIFTVADDATGSLDVATLIVTIDLNAQFPVVPNPEVQVRLWNRLRPPQAALHVVGSAFVIALGNYASRDFFRFY
jgi:hypothetical protein